ncbi:tubulin polyglutamylase TTLL11-like [Ciona intestinalis]
MRPGESKWSVIANGKSIANGTTYRHNGIISLTVTTQCKDTSTADNKEPTKEDEEEIVDEPTPVVAKQPETNRFPPLRVCTSGAKGSNEALSSAIQQLNWRECKNGLKSGPIDIYWVGLGFDEQVYSKPGVYAVNKLPGMVELVQKVHLSRIIKRMQLLFPGEFDFYPPTWFLPEQYHQFVGEMTVNKKPKPNRQTATPRGGTPVTKRESQTYIVKPDTGSQGEGIHLVSDPRDVHAVVGSRPAVVQKYIENPILLDGYKFDLRMYVVVARLHPVEIYLCKDGLARLCTVPYESPSTTNINNTLMHLTNYSLNKYSGDFIHTTAANTGSKRTYSSARRSLRKQGYDVDKIHEKIVDVVIKTVLSLIPDVTIWDHVTNKSKLVRSFQILGFDILLTSDEKVHLLEVNSSPSTGIDAERETEPGSGVMQTVISPVDEQIKVPLLRDSLRLIAYGENEVDMSKSCLERIYPAQCLNPYPKDHKPTTELETDNKSSLKNQQLNNTFTERKPMTPEPHLPVQINVNQQNDEKSESKANYFDNPLLNPNLTTTSTTSIVPHKRQKRFTVVKYRHVLSPPNYNGGIMGLFSNKKPLGVVITTQQLYKSMSSANDVYDDVIGEETFEKNTDVITPNWKSDNESDVTWENDVTPTTRRAQMPPRSIYFNSAQLYDRNDVTIRSVTSHTTSHTKPPIKTRCSKCESALASDDVIMNRKQPEVNENFSIQEVTLLKRAAAVFIYFNGFKSSLRIGATAFRNMARRCRLCEQGSMPAVDILFIDTMRQWQGYTEARGSPFYDTFKGKNPVTSHQPAGLPFQGFLEALFRLAKSRFRGSTLKEKLESLLTNCECYVTEAMRADKLTKRRRQAKYFKKPMTSPRITCSTSQRLPFFQS